MHQLFLTTVTPTVKHEGEMLRQYLRKRNISQKEFADKLGYADRSAFIKYLNMQTIPAHFKDTLYSEGVLLFKEEYEATLNYQQLYAAQVEENARLTKQIVELQAELITYLKAKQ